ncbi:MAG: hypothetical protein BMS9Abin07_0601 [Acidimicrobiia bacterium]|nr:MAG: hypothetical protein BMS9Abin07_0601 [Acidimicrobiia bacterium]
MTNPVTGHARFWINRLADLRDVVEHDDLLAPTSLITIIDDPAATRGDHFARPIAYPVSDS